MKTLQSSDDDTTSGKKTVNIEMRENQKNSGQRQEDDRNNDEAIVLDIVNGCAEDEEGYYFDEYGMGLTGSSSKVAPSERPNIPIVSTAEELMSFEVFAEIERDGPFQPSGSTCSSSTALLATHSGVGSTFQVLVFRL